MAAAARSCIEVRRFQYHPHVEVCFRSLGLECSNQHSNEDQTEFFYLGFKLNHDHSIKQGLLLSLKNERLNQAILTDLLENLKPV